MKKLSVFALLMLFLSFNVDTLLAEGKYKALIKLKIREEPNNNAAVIGEVDKDATFDILNKNGINWDEIEYNGVRGWVNGKFVGFVDVNSEDSNNNNGFFNGVSNGNNDYIPQQDITSEGNGNEDTNPDINGNVGNLPGNNGNGFVIDNRPTMMQNPNAGNNANSGISISNTSFVPDTTPNGGNSGRLVNGVRAVPVRNIKGGGNTYRLETNTTFVPNNNINNGNNNTDTNGTDGNRIQPNADNGGTNLK